MELNRAQTPVGLRHMFVITSSSESDLVSSFGGGTILVLAFVSMSFLSLNGSSRNKKTAKQNEMYYLPPRCFEE